MVRFFFTLCLQLAVCFVLNGCVFLHHVQIGDIDDQQKNRVEHFEIMVSETGINLDEATSIAKRLATTQKTRDQMEQVNSIIGMFQMGPRTGNIVFNEAYAEPILELIMSRCPSGNITNLTSIREMKKYPVISGEIVRITGRCQS